MYLKYTEIRNKIKRSLNTRFHSRPIYDGQYIKTKVKTFSSMINTFFSGNDSICIDSVLKIEKKNYPQVYLDQCKYKIKRRKPVDFIDAEVDLSPDDSEDADDLA